MQQKNKLLFILFFSVLIIGGCTSTIEEIQDNEKVSSNNDLDSNIGDLDQLEQELNEIDNLDLSDLDF